MSDVVVIGGGGHAKVVISTLRACGHSVPAVFDDDTAQWGTQILGVPVSGPAEAACRAGYEWGFIAIGQNTARQSMARRLNLRWLVLVHPTAYVAPEVKLGDGTVVMAGAIVQPGSVIGEQTIVNTGATLDHDCRVENFAHLAPGVHLAGNVHVAEGAFLGTGCVVIPGRQVGAWTTVGAGAVVVRDLPGEVVAYGVPARPQRSLEKPPAAGPGCAVLRPDQNREWRQVLEGCAQYDFYHLPEFQQLEADRSEAQARLFVYREGEHMIGLPLLLRPVDPAARESWWDATSVYGYAGPVASPVPVPDSVRQNFHSALRQTLAEHRIVSVFSRLHPLIPQEGLLAGLGECQSHGRTVAMDLTQTPEQQRAAYRGAYRTRINRLQREGVVCVRDEEGRHMAEFVDIYHETMRRVGAHHSYFFGADYFAKLAEGLGATLQLFVVIAAGRVAAGGLFTLCNGIVQYHLGGTRDEFLDLSPNPLIVDSVRLWANQMGSRVFHLGGGVGSKEDSLFHFKTGFSDGRHTFNTWRWVVAPEIYRKLCEETGVATDTDYFPAYRSPILMPA